MRMIYGARCCAGSRELSRMWRPVLLLLLLLLGEGEVLPRDMWQEARLLQGACFRKCKEASASASRR